MRGAPPVQLACGRGRLAAAAVAGTAAVASATLIGWWSWHARWPLAAMVPAMMVAALAAAAVGGWLAAGTERRLAWDGHAWLLDDQPGVVAVMMDTGGWMLLQVRTAASVAWLPLDLRSCGAPAHLARAALRAHAGQAPVGAGYGPDLHG